jgi:DNA polymerase I-like protein with 3'-5' exonuclease and polymerase domains
MILDIDASQLEWRVAAELSQDTVMIQEIIDGIDIHTDNAINFFGDIKFRQDAKIFSFRLLYGGTSYAFFMDNKMPSFSLKKWDGIVEAFYSKYKGLYQWQNNNYALVCRQGWYSAFTGRRWSFEPKRQRDGSFLYSRPSVCNYIVQGVSTGDIMPLVMVIVYKRLSNLNLLQDVKIINQVHDSIIFDLPSKHIDSVVALTSDIFTHIPKHVKDYWGYDWIVPMASDAKYGINWGDMTKYKK